MGLKLSVEIHGECYSKAYIGSLSYNKAYQMLGVCDSVKDCEFVCNAWNMANENALKVLEI